MLHFQILTRTESEAEDFMETILAEDVAIEEWDFEEIDSGRRFTEVYGFGVTHYTPEELEQMANFMGVELVYAESDEEIDQRFEALMQQIAQMKTGK